MQVKRKDSVITFLETPFKLENCEKRIWLNAVSLYKLPAINYDTHIRPSHITNPKRLNSQAISSTFSSKDSFGATSERT